MKMFLLSIATMTCVTTCTALDGLSAAYTKSVGGYNTTTSWHDGVFTTSLNLNKDSGK